MAVVEDDEARKRVKQTQRLEGYEDRDQHRHRGGIIRLVSTQKETFRRAPTEIETRNGVSAEHAKRKPTGTSQRARRPGCLRKLCIEVSSRRAGNGTLPASA